MLLLPAADARDAAAAAACCPLGLQTLIAAATPSSTTYPTGGGNVATRTIAASPRAVRGLAAAAPGGAGADGCDGKEGRAGDGCWVSYGWRRLPRRLPPPIPSLRPLARERTADGRLVISREEEAAHRVGARKVEDRRLVLELVDDGGGAAPPAHHQRRWSHPLAAVQEAASNKPPSVPAAGEEDAAAQAPAAASPVPAGACFEGAIRAASLRGTMRMSLPRMVH